MNKEDIIRMAREAGMFVTSELKGQTEVLERFAALVAEREAVRLTKVDVEPVAKLSLSTNGVQVEADYGVMRYGESFDVVPASALEALQQDHIQRLLRIEEKVDALIAERDTLRAENERLIVQLAGCGVAALGNTESSKEQRAKQGDYGYSESYAEVCRAVDREIELRAQLEQAQASREALALALETEREAANRYAKQVAHWIEKHDAAQADAARLREALKKIADDADGPYTDGWCGDIAREALGDK